MRKHAPTIPIWPRDAQNALYRSELDRCISSSLEYTPRTGTLLDISWVVASPTGPIPCAVACSRYASLYVIWRGHTVNETSMAYNGGVVPVIQWGIPIKPINPAFRPASRAAGVYGNIEDIHLENGLPSRWCGCPFLVYSPFSSVYTLETASRAAGVYGLMGNIHPSSGLRGCRCRGADQRRSGACPPATASDGLSHPPDELDRRHPACQPRNPPRPIDSKAPPVVQWSYVAPPMHFRQNGESLNG